MVSLSTPKHFRTVQDLPFCYVCGKDFAPGDSWDRDHVPAKKAFHVRHRDPPLWLPTHETCNNDHSETDKKVAQLIGLRWGKVTSDPRLEITWYGPGRAAITNLNIEAVVLRWVRAYHAALYREPLVLGSFHHAVITPFPTAPRTSIVPTIRPILPEHEAFVQTVKEQRVLRNLDSIVSNKGKLVYECVWTRFDASDRWLCVFALDFYNWKDLGRIPGQPMRGCAGYYSLSGRVPPEAATRARGASILIPNLDTLDPFAA